MNNSDKLNLYNMFTPYESDNWGHKIIYKANIDIPISSKHSKILLCNDMSCEFTKDYKPMPLLGGDSVSKISINTTNLKDYDYIYLKDLVKKIENNYENVDDKKYITIRRYFINGFDSLNVYYDDQPTFCHALFLPTKQINKYIDIMKQDYKTINNYASAWKYIATRYLINLFISMNVYCNLFPLSSTIIYLDIHTLNIFEKINDDNPYINLNKILNIDEIKDMFVYYDNTQSQLGSDININLQNLYKFIINEFNYKKFNNLKERFLSLLQLSSTFYSSTIIIRNLEIYDYEFKDLYTKYINSTDNTYIGQSIRYISAAKQDHIFKFSSDINIYIKYPKHLIWLDAHSNRPGIRMYEWINNFNNICKIYKKEIYLIPNAYHYNAPWHDIAQDNYLGWQQTKTAIGGIIQIANYINTTTSCLTNNIFMKTFGLPYIIDKNNELLIYKIRPHQEREPGNILSKFDYGIDEYVLVNFFTENYVIKRSLYFQFNFITDIWFNIWQYPMNKINTFLKKNYYIKINKLIGYDFIRKEYYLQLNNNIIEDDLNQLNKDDLNNLYYDLFNHELISYSSTSYSQYKMHETFINNTIDDINKIIDELNNIRLKFIEYIQFNFIKDIKNKCLIILFYYLKNIIILITIQLLVVNYYVIV